MTLLLGPPATGSRRDDVATSGAHTADTATLVALFVTLQFVLPSKLVLKYLPLSLSAASLIALGLGVLWFCTQLTTTLGAAKGSNPVRTLLFAYCLVLLASYAWSASGYLPSDERQMGDHAMVTVFAMVFVALAVCDGVRSRERLTFVLRVCVVCASLVSIVGILQFLFNYDLTPHMVPPGMHLTSDDVSLLDRSGLRRVSGTTAHPIEFGVFCAMALPMALHVAFRETPGRRRHALWWVCVGLIAAGVMFSVSRSAILGIIAAAVVLFTGWRGSRRLWMAVSGVAFLAVIKVASPGLLGTFLNLFRNAGSDPSIQWRTHDYATAQDLISHHLLLGRGTGTWYAPKHEVFDNQYLLTLVHSGVLGLVTFVGIFVAAVYATARVGLALAGRPREDLVATEDRDLALSLAASLVVVFPTFATFDFAAFGTVTSLAFVLVGCSGALLRIVRAEAAGEPPDPHAVS